MAERGAWTSIKARGLLSTSALLDVYKLAQLDRYRIERQHRPRSIAIRSSGLPRAVIRDQMVMSDADLERCLPAHLSPSDWYQLLNTKCFFCLTEARLHRLTGARAYRDMEHDIIELKTRSLMNAHRDRIWLCPINSGCTKPMRHPRDERIFARIAEYPYTHWRRRRSRGERAVELAVDHSVPDIFNHIRRVIVKKGTSTVEVIE